jgi:hypothetical protein
MKTAPAFFAFTVFLQVALTGCVGESGVAKVNSGSGGSWTPINGDLDLNMKADAVVAVVSGFSASPFTIYVPESIVEPVGRRLSSQRHVSARSDRDWPYRDGVMRPRDDDSECLIRILYVKNSGSKYVCVVSVRAISGSVYESTFEVAGGRYRLLSCRLASVE